MANIFTEWYQGISRSRGDAQGFPNLVNCDVHSEMGFITNQVALENDTLTGTPNEQTILVKTPAGTIYAFSKSSGKIWKLSNGSTWSTVTANTNATGHLGAMYYNGNIYYATATKLGRFVAETEVRVPAGNLPNQYGDSWQTFSNTSSYRPMEEVNLTLFIGNGKDVASVNSGSNFYNSALDTPPNYTVTALAGSGVELVVGTAIGNFSNRCKVFLWDTFSDSWTVEDEIPEASVNCFIKDDDTLYALCGISGQLYYWSGSAMVRFRRLPGFGKEYGVYTSVNPYASGKIDGRSLIAARGKIFSIHREDNDLPYAIVQEYTTISGNVHSITSYNNTTTMVNQLIVAAGSNIEKTGSTYATAVITTPEISGNADNIIVYYDSIGSGCTVGISTMIDNSGSYSVHTPIIDTIKKVVRHDGGLGDVNFIQAKITLTPYSTNKIKLRAIEIK